MPPSCSLTQKRIVFLACLILVIGLMAIDFINPSLPYIMRDLSISQGATKGLVATYILAVGCAQIFYGTFSDNYGRRRAIILAFAIAVVGFILSALSRNITMLYLARFITAAGIAGSPVITRALIADVCHDEPALKKAFSYFAMSSQLSPALAPILGGVIQEYASWQFSFIALALINLATLIFLYHALPESHQPPMQKKILREQLEIYTSFLTMRRFMIFCFLSSLIMVFTMGYYSLIPFVLHPMGINAAENGLMCVPYAGGLTLGAYTLSTFLHRFSSEKTFIATICFYLLFFSAFSIISIWHTNIWLIGLFGFVVGFICGISAALTLSLCMQGFQQNRGAASAMQAAIRYFFTGAVLLSCNFIEITNLNQLALIFLGVSLAITVLYSIEHYFKSRETQIMYSFKEG